MTIERDNILDWLDRSTLVERTRLAAASGIALETIHNWQRRKHRISPACRRVVEAILKQWEEGGDNAHAR